MALRCGVKFCGGCNPRYDRGSALEKLKSGFNGGIDIEPAEEGAEYDMLLVIGGCTNCCATYQQYRVGKSVLKMWDESHIKDIAGAINDMITEDRNSGLEECV